MSRASRGWGALLGILVVAVGAGAAEAAGAADDGRQAPLLEGLGDHHFAITTDVPRAQTYFDQGLALSYGFNHAEAARSFREVTRLDPDCAMGWWGIALVLGPNINATMEDDDVPEAWNALRKAHEFAHLATEKERAFIRALEKRYVADVPEDRAPLDLAYAEAMREVARAYPDDVDALTLFAEALMDTHPWDYWEKSGQPRPWTPEIVAVLEDAMKLHPDHAGANHLYIHAVEASREPERALSSADKLGRLCPGAGHLVHMPSHIYIRVGRYHDGSVANERAIEADDAYITQCRQQGLYPLAYMPHNHHFLWATATLEGDSEKAMMAAHHTSKMADPEMMRKPGLGTLQHFAVIPLYAMVRFGRWEDVFEQPEPAEDLPYMRAIWHYARGLAFDRTGRPEKAQAELAALDALSHDPALDEVTIWDINATASLVRIAVNVLAGELAATRGDWDTAIESLREAVRIEDGLAYNEPPDWFFPVRQNLGAVLLEAGRPEEAEAVYRRDLEEFPENGWSLWGLRQSLAATGRPKEADEVARRFERAWGHADIALTSSRF